MYCFGRKHCFEVKNSYVHKCVVMVIIIIGAEITVRMLLVAFACSRLLPRAKGTCKWRMCRLNDYNMSKHRRRWCVSRMWITRLILKLLAFHFFDYIGYWCFNIPVFPCGFQNSLMKVNYQNQINKYKTTMVGFILYVIFNLVSFFIRSKWWGTLGKWMMTQSENI